MTTARQPQTPAPLVTEAVWRKARKQWKCECPGRGAGHAQCPHTMCSQTIKRGSDYVEYLGEAAAYQSGTRYCPPCGYATWGAQATTDAAAPSSSHDHPSLTEPVLRDHLRTVHRWQPLAALRPTYFIALVAHQREHRKSDMQAAS